MEKGGLTELERSKLEKRLELQRRCECCEDSKGLDTYLHVDLDHCKLILERETVADDRTVFVKIHAPFKTLAALAEETKLVLPLQVCGCVCYLACG